MKIVLQTDGKPDACRPHTVKASESNMKQKSFHNQLHQHIIDNQSIRNQNHQGEHQVTFDGYKPFS